MTTDGEAHTEQTLFVGFVDILGFKAILADWNRARAFHERMIVLFRAFRGMFAGSLELAGSSLDIDSEEDAEYFRARILSDSFIFTTSQAWIAVQAAALLQNYLLDFGVFCRGCIAYGRHLEERASSGDFVVVSEGLAWAADSEAKRAIYPRIFLHESALDAIKAHALATPHFALQLSDILVQANDDLWSVDPSHGVPHLDLMMKAIQAQLSEAHPPQILAKYQWLAEQFDFLNCPPSAPLAQI